MFSGASNITNEVDKVFLFIIGISVVLLLLVTGMMIFFVIKYSKKRHSKPGEVKDSLLLEVLWTAIPTALVMGMFYYGYLGFRLMRDIPEDHIDIKVIGQMWFWKFEYDNGKQSDELYVPVNEAVKLSITSVDVNHNFYVPAFRIKHDAVPGMENEIWFEAEKEGVYDIFCAEYCGLQHAYMLSKVHVVGQAEYQKWYSQTESETAEELIEAATAE